MLGTRVTSGKDDVQDERDIGDAWDVDDMGVVGHNCGCHHGVLHYSIWLREKSCWRDFLRTFFFGGGGTNDVTM